MRLVIRRGIVHTISGEIELMALERVKVKWMYIIFYQSAHYFLNLAYTHCETFPVAHEDVFFPTIGVKPKGCACHFRLKNNFKIN